MRKDLRQARYLCGFLMLLISVSIFCASSSFLFNEQKIIKALTQNYGERAALRGKAWLAILHSSGQLDDKEKLSTVNNFFNMLYFIDDQKLWGEPNYWATPVEFVGVNGGDC